MASLSKDVSLDEEAFHKAAADMKALRQRTSDLRNELKQLYDDFAGALQSEAGEELNIAAESVLLEPIDNLALVINQMAETLDILIQTGYYQDIFSEFRELKDHL